MRRFLLGLLLLATLGGLAWTLLRPRPSLDLDRLEDMLSELGRAHALARRAADTDALPAYLDEEAAYLYSLAELLIAPTGDCQAAVDEALLRHREHLALIASRPDWLTPERLQALSAAQRQQAGLKAVYALQPAWARLGAAVQRFAWACKRESGELSPILFGAEVGLAP